MSTEGKLGLMDFLKRGLRFRVCGLIGDTLRMEDDKSGEVNRYVRIEGFGRTYNLSVDTDEELSRFKDLSGSPVDCRRPASSVTEDDAAAFKAHLLKERGFSPVSTAASITDCRSMYRYAIRKKLVVGNPFECIVAGPLTNDSRFRFIERETIEHVLNYCIGDHMRFGVMLSRYAGLRISSEIRYMKYSDFGGEGFFVHENTKTGRREVPFFHELREMFQRLKEQNKGDEYVFPRSFVTKWGLTSRFLCTLERAKVERWPRLFNNLRASCVTEYDELGFTEKTLDSIFGNTERIRKRHYSGFRKDRAFMQLLGTKNAIVDELVSAGGNCGAIIETGKIDLLVRYLESLKISQGRFEPEKTGLSR